ncbi:glycosyl hydrolase family 8 [Caulobacter sp. Root1455]|uniref:glycosyl hydrolase family 8 n=2 Tax=unclassified Caulobacter TaxID=2648921 RepID=UPI0019101380|nr:glycosyl hydrolase family 8 [Caulobacter sp. Root1455]
MIVKPMSRLAALMRTGVDFARKGPALRALLAILLLGPPQGACAMRDQDGWSTFKADYLAADGRVIDTGNGGVSHSEGQGYGMLLAEAHGDRAAFDRLWGWTGVNLMRDDVRLFRWRYDPRVPRSGADPNNATDGDILIAWALLRASRRWNDRSYAADSAAIRAAIAKRLVAEIGGRRVLLPGLDGFRQQDAVIYNPSYFVLPALQAFAAADPAGPWDRLIQDGLTVARDAQFGAQSLPADWVRISASGAVTPDPGHPPRFGFDAVRAPLYLVWGGVAGQAPATASARFWRRYEGANWPPPAWIDVQTGAKAAFPLSPGGQAVARLVADLPAQKLKPAPEDYYSAALGLLAEQAARERRSRGASQGPVRP